MERKNQWDLEWKRWRAVPEQLHAVGLNCVEEAADVFVVSPKLKAVQNGSKRYRLLVTGVIHGVEVAGLAILNDFAALLAMQPQLLQAPVVLAIGNKEAALAQKRFLERDLNRCFARTTFETHEEKRAQVLAHYLENTDFYLDLHQTTEPSALPFFIFPYEAKSLAFATAIDPRIPVVTHWGKPFSQDGCCSDEFVQKRGGIGITLEVGQNGFQPYHISVGFAACWRALIWAMEQRRLVAPISPRYYTWAEVRPYPEGDVALNEGWYNFKEVSRQQELGRANGNAVYAEADGFILFPKYMREPQQARPAELFRIIKPVAFEQLGLV